MEDKDKTEDIDKLEEELELLRTKCATLTKEYTGMMESKERRASYAMTELLEIKAQKLSRTGKWGDAQKKKLEDIISKARELSSSVKLLHIREKFSTFGLIFDKIDELIRLIAVWGFLIVGSVLLALPCLFLFPLDSFLAQKRLIDPKYQIGVLCKRLICTMIVKLSGISLEVEQKNMESFGKDCCVVCFSHSSTLDAFILAAVTPVRHYTLVSL